jgi:hypothetical protein
MGHWTAAQPGPAPGRMGPHGAAWGRMGPHGARHGARPKSNPGKKDKKARSRLLFAALALLGQQPTGTAIKVWLDRATIRFRFFGPSSFNTALQLVLRPHFLVNFV